MSTMNNDEDNISLPVKRTNRGGAASAGGRHQSSPSSEDELRERREALGLSRARLAQAADVPVSRVWAVEHPDTGVSPEDRERIIAVLNGYRAAIAKLTPLI